MIKALFLSYYNFNYLNFLNIKRVKTFIIQVNTLQTENACKLKKLTMQTLKQQKKYSKEVFISCVQL